MKFGLEPFVLDRIIDILKKFPAVQSASLFGSRVKNTYKNYSDIDIAIHAPTIDAQDFARLNFEIQETPIIYKIDVVHFDTIGTQALVDKIRAEEQTFYKADALGTQ